MLTPSAVLSLLAGTRTPTYTPLTPYTTATSPLWQQDLSLICTYLDATLHLPLSLAREAHTKSPTPTSLSLLTAAHSRAAAGVPFTTLCTLIPGPSSLSRTRLALTKGVSLRSITAAPSGFR